MKSRPRSALGTYVAYSQPTGCKVPGCPSPSRSLGFCRPHYYRWHCFGDPLHFSGRERGTPESRFWAKVQRNGATECWDWTGSTLGRGYGSFWPGGAVSRVSAHRFAFELANGPIPEGLQIDHLCRNRRCVNPSHMELVSLAENVRRGNNHNRDKTHCPQGHLYSPDNIYWTKRGKGYKCRACKACHKAYDKRRRVARYTLLSNGSMPLGLLA